MIGSASDFNITSGPMPAGSPMVMATMGLLGILEETRQRLPAPIMRDCRPGTWGYGFFEENGLIESKIEEKTPLFESLAGSGGAKTSGASSTVSVVNIGTPNMLTTLFPDTGLFGS